MYYVKGRCNYCEKETGDISSICDSCYEHKVKPQNDKYSKTYIRKTTYLDNYGNVSNARLDELNRRIIVGKDKDGSDILCRIGENGKIQDRQPDYYDW